MQGFITLVTFVCWIIHGFQATTWVSQNNLKRDALAAVDLTVLCIVSLELLGRIYVYGLRVVLKGWTTLDMMMVTASWVTVGGPYATVRVVRVFRLLRQIPNLRIVVESFMLAFPSIFWVLAIILMYISVFAVMGVSFFGEDFPTLYGSVSRASYSLFKATTLEGWVEDADTVYARYSSSYVFYSTFITLNTFVLLNLLIGLIVDSIQQIGNKKRREIKRKEEEQKLRQEAAVAEQNPSATQDADEASAASPSTPLQAASRATPKQCS